jgi:hypothetical protein
MKYAMPKFVVSALGAVLMTVSAVSGSAQPGGGSVQSLAGAAHGSLTMERIQYRRNFDGRRNYGRRNDGRNIGLGIAGLVIGGIILNEAARAEHRGSHGSDWDRCAQTYRSFERNTGMYTGYDGIRRPCPYLN